MPVQACEVDGKPGWRYGESGKCYTYPPGDEKASGEAKRKAYVQGVAIGGGQLAESVQLMEVFEGGPTMRVDREAGIIREVKVLGPKSLNGRQYTPEAVRRGKTMYEGRAVNCNHPPRSAPDTERAIEDRFGWLQDVRDDSTGGLVADLHFLKSDPRAEKICEAAERRPQLFGLSHNAEGKIKMKEGKALVEEITRVRSVDIVSDPATTKSLFESYQRSPFMEGDMPGLDPAASAADPTAGIKQGFRDAALAAFDDDSLDLAGKAGKIKDILKAMEKAMQALGETNDKPVDDKPAEMKPDTTPAAESVDPKAAEVAAENARLKAELQARNLLEAAGIKPTAPMLKAMIALDSEDDRKALIESWPKPAVKPRSSSPLQFLESKDGEKKSPVPDDLHAFATMLKG